MADKIVPAELQQKLAEVTSSTGKAVNEMLMQTQKLPVGSSGPGLFANSQRVAAKDKNTKALTECGDTIRTQARQLTNTTNVGLNRGGSTTEV